MDEIIQEQKISEIEEGKFLTFNLGDEEYGIPINTVIEIIGIQKITELPDLPFYIKGAINLRGKVIPVIDVRLRFQMPAREYDERTCVIVIQLAEQIVGFIVDSVSEVMDIASSQIDPPPSINQSNKNRYIKGIGKAEDSMKILLDVEKLISGRDINIEEKNKELVEC